MSNMPAHTCERAPDAYSTQCEVMLGGAREAYEHTSSEHPPSNSLSIVETFSFFPASARMIPCLEAVQPPATMARVLPSGL